MPITVPPLRDRQEDILLLFRLFASQAATENNVPPIELDEKAVELFLKYRWPGNVRELKNITERMSLLEENRTISAEVAKTYLQEDGMRDLHPVLVTPQQSFQAEGGSPNERDLLYKLLFDLNRSVYDLKKQFDELKGTVSSTHTAVEKAPTPLSNVAPQYTHIEPTEILLDTEQHEEVANHLEENPSTLKDRLDDTERKELACQLLDGMTLKEIEELITRYVLDKNLGHKGNTAEQLGIANRTLYRRLREYGIEE